MVIPPNRTWSHLVYGHCFDYRLIVDLLEQYFGADNSYRETRESIAGLYALRFTAQGKMVEDSFVLSSAAWLAGRILTGSELLSGFEDAQSTAAEIAAETLEGVVTPVALEALSEKIIAHLYLAGFFSPAPSRYICRSTPVRPSTADATDDPLNSFLLDDLARVASSIAGGESSAALEAYLSLHDGTKRVDLSDDASSGTQCGLLALGRYPTGCWPAPGDLGLVHSQQLAVNAIRDGLARGAGLLSVNGPPGTGKTTLLRDIVAAVVTNRADALARLATSSDAFLDKGTVVDADKNRGYWPLHQIYWGTRSSLRRRTMAQSRTSPWNYRRSTRWTPAGSASTTCTLILHRWSPGSRPGALSRPPSAARGGEVSSSTHLGAAYPGARLLLMLVRRSSASRRQAPRGDLMMR
ncbi:hypothetical protein A8O37_25480 [Pseudomonas aeruginosa]|nr:hypothetical protein A8O37_25480 [Pseudomonas aeruginosa]